ncbi:hypothetical protein CRYUN_Cryun26dG0103900 [Craigia yunnanensis]
MICYSLSLFGGIAGQQPPYDKEGCCHHLSFSLVQIKVDELTAENKHLHEENGRLNTENRHLKEENGQLSTENKHLKDENGSLAVENKHLEDRIRGLHSKGKLPAEDTQRQDSYISQSISQLDHQSVYVQDHHGVGSNNEEAVYMLDHHRMDSDIEGAVDGV